MRMGGANLDLLLSPIWFLKITYLAYCDLKNWHKNKNNPEYDNLFFEGNSIPFGYQLSTVRLEILFIGPNKMPTDLTPTSS